MQISKGIKAIAGLACVVGLAACDGAPTTMGFLDPTVMRDDGPPEVRKAVLAESVVITAPDRYCVDAGSRRNEVGAAFVVLAPCAGLKVPGVDWPKTVALITVSATRDSLPAASTADLEAFLTSPDGRRLLTSDGAGTVDILQTASQRGAFFVRVAEARAPVAALEATYWRGFVAAGGRLVSVTVRGYDAEPLDASTGFNLIQNFATRIRTDSQGGTSQAPLEGLSKPTNSFAALFRNRE